MSVGKGLRNEPLSDHIREGKVFRTPLSRLPLRETSWVKQTMPELLWIGLLQEIHGLAYGVDLSLALAEAAIQAKPNAPNSLWFTDTSSYAMLQESEWHEIQRVLIESDKLSDIKRALVSLVYFYPECPYVHLFADIPEEPPDKVAALNNFKATLESLYGKQERAATLVQGTTAYIALATGRVALMESVSLGNLEALTDYPRTEESQKIGASVRAMCNFLAGNSLGTSDFDWSEYFWDRGFELEPCQYELPYKT